MVKKKRFILELPYFLATDAGSWGIKILFASCYAVLALSYIIPIYGVLVSIGYCLAVWQFFNIRYSKEKKYSIYSRFLLQRVVFCSVFVLALFMYCAQDGSFDITTWWFSVALLALLNLSDIYFTLKGMVGIGYINGKKKKNNN